MVITGKYCLTEAGRKVAALQGVEAQRNQCFTVPVSDVDSSFLQKILEIEGVQPDGNVLIAMDTPIVFSYKVVERNQKVTNQSFSNELWYTEHTIVQDSWTPEFDKPLGLKELVDAKERVLLTNKALKESADKALAECKAADQTSRAKAEATWARIQREQEFQAEKRRQANEEDATKQEIRRAQEEEARRLWIQQHGSERLRLALELGMDHASKSVYLDERLAHEHPGFIYDKNWHRGEVQYKDVINPTLEELQVLKEVRTKFPGAALEFAQLIEEDDYTGEKNTAVRERVVTANFLGHLIVRRF